MLILPYKFYHTCIGDIQLIRYSEKYNYVHSKNDDYILMEKKCLNLNPQLDFFPPEILSIIVDYSICFPTNIVTYDLNPYEELPVIKGNNTVLCESVYKALKDKNKMEFKIAKMRNFFGMIYFRFPLYFMLCFGWIFIDNHLDTQWFWFVDVIIIFCSFIFDKYFIFDIICITLVFHHGFDHPFVINDNISSDVLLFALIIISIPFISIIAFYLTRWTCPPKG